MRKHAWAFVEHEHGHGLDPEHLGTYRNRTHTREVCDGRRASKNKHRRHDNIRGKSVLLVRRHAIRSKNRERAPEEHEDEMSCCSPASSDNLKPSVCEWSVELQLCCEL